jgi:multiple sugar transport system permease protein
VAAPPVAAGRPTAYRRELRLLLAPYLLGGLVLVAVPALLAMALAFTQFDAVSPPRWFGLRNFVMLAADPRLPVALGNSFFYLALAVPLRVLGALLLALLLRERRPGVGLFRAAVYLPTVIPDVAYALVWLWIFNPFYGPLNLLLGAAGLPTPAWLVEAETAKPALVFMSLFQIGEGFVLLLAGLHSLSRDYYASAAVDGASRWQMFRWITLPLVAPWLALLTIRDVILSFQTTFTPAYIMTGGDPYYATLFLPLLVFKEAFDNFRFGNGAALLTLLFLTTAVLIAALLVAWRGWMDTDER